jgi:RNA polymerase sigma-70 factor (ECF subfamily)
VDSLAVDDSSLMLRYRDGDLRAFELLYARHKAALYRYLQRLTRDVEAANDLFQDVWGRIIASRDRYEVRAQFKTFLFQIAHNCAVDYFRRLGRAWAHPEADIAELSEVVAGDEMEAPESRASAAEIRQAFRRALDTLPPEQRDVFLLYEECGLSLDEIGQVTGVGKETAKSRLRYAVGKLRAALEPYQPASIAS